MDIDDYKPFEGAALKTKIQSLSRSELDEQLQRFGGQYALLCQRLEAIYSPYRLDRFIAIRPGGIEDIDKAIALTDPDNPKELALLQSFRELNRVLLPFMDVYEEQVLGDLRHMSKEELQELAKNVADQAAVAENQQKQNPADYRTAQNTAGTERLTALMQEAIGRELKDRFGIEPGN